MTDIIVVHAHYPDNLGRIVEGKLVRVPDAPFHGRGKRPYKWIGWLGHASGLSEAGARRALEQVNFDCNEGRATAIEINNDEVEKLGGI
jgi:hypothetical protein